MFETLTCCGSLRDSVTGRAEPVAAYLTVGSPKPNISKGRSQTKRDTLALQVGGWSYNRQICPGKNKTAKNSQLLKAGQMNRRHKRVLRNKKDNIYLGTWNVQIMLLPGKMQAAAEQILHTKLQAVAQQEILWIRSGPY